MSKQPQTTLFYELKEGDLVTHASMGDGVVTDKSHGDIFVKYEKGNGQYDEWWFQQYPTLLWKRNHSRTMIEGDLYA